jgi:hypothetical protein
MWIHIPETTDPKTPATVARQSTMPHGDSLLAQSTFIKDVAGGPVIDAVDSFPFTDPQTVRPSNGDPFLQLQYLQRSHPGIPTEAQ